MAKWVNIKGQTQQAGGMIGSIEYDRHGSDALFYQDEKPFIEAAKLDRELGHRENFMGAKKFATIPDLVAIEINEKYGIDLHDPNISSDADKMNRFKYIIRTEYPYLLSF